MASVDILRAARARIEDPDHLTIDVLARDAWGRECDPDSREAVRWCALGAFYSVIGDDIFPPSELLLTDTANRLFGLGIENVNDTLGHAAVLKVYDAAIAAAEAEAGR